MLRYQRFAYRSVVVVVAALFVLACGLIGPSILTRSTTLAVESSELTLTNFPIGEEKILSFSVRNRSFFGAAQIVGIRGACGQGCVEEIDFQPFQLKPGESKRLSVLFKSPRQPGPIEVAFTLYFTSSNRTRILGLCVTGNAMEGESR